MRRSLFYIFCLLFLIPIISVKAASITNVGISGTDSVTTGSEFSLSFSMNYSGIDKGSSNTMGIGGVIFELSFDNSVFSVISASSNGFRMEKAELEGKYYVISTINESGLSNKCVDGILHCTNYSATITFFVKDTEKTSSNISIRDGNAVLFKVNSDYEEDDAVIITSPSESTHVVNIVKGNSTTIEEPKSIISNSNSNPKNAISKVETKVSKVKQNKKDDATKTSTTKMQVSKSNNNLTSLKIKNHRINFDKDKLDYKVIVKENENNIDVEAVTEDEKASVVITGADDLKKNDYKVLVEVTAQDGSKKTYTINAEQSNKMKITKKQEKTRIKINKNTIKIIIITLGIVLIFGITFFIISHKNNKKLDKMLDEFDKL